MKCSEIEELISSYANGQLFGVQKDLVENHCTSCEKCRTTLASYQTVREQLLSPKVIPDMPDITNAIMNKINRMNARKRTLRWVRPSLAAIPVAAIMITLFVLQPWSPSGGTTTVMAMDQLIAKVNTTTIYDNLQSYRVTVFDSALIDESGNIQPFSDVYDFELVLPDLMYLKIESLQTRNTNEYVFVRNDEYYLASNDISLDYTSAINKFGGFLNKSKTLALLRYITDSQQLPDEVIDGVVCLHYKGVSTGTFDTTKAPIELWIGKDDNLIRQIIQKLPEQNGIELVSIRKFCDFNAPITIQVPVTASGDLLPNWKLSTPLMAHLILPSNWIVQNDSCPDPYFARVTFPTSWLYTPIETKGGAGDLVLTIPLDDLKKLPSDVNTYIPGIFKMAIEITEGYTTFFFPFSDAEKSFPKYLVTSDSPIVTLPDKVTLPPVTYP